jgi:uncharacterized protein HemX
MADTFQKRAVAFGLVLVTLVVASVAYYYVIALPRHNAERLRFERQKYEDEKAAKQIAQDKADLEKAQKEGEQEAKKDALNRCLGRADENAEEYVKINGGKVTDQGTIEAPRYIWDESEKKKKVEKDECYREYRQ